MEPTIQSILARFSGNIQEAINYCTATGKQYPNLRAEYQQYAAALRRRKKAHV